MMEQVVGFCLAVMMVSLTIVVVTFSIWLIALMFGSVCLQGL